MRYAFLSIVVLLVVCSKAGGVEVPTTEAIGLVWTNVDPNVHGRWDQADQYCTANRFKGDSGWRLPTMAELRAYYVGMAGGFPWGSNDVDWVWSSTPQAPGSHYLVNVNNNSTSWPGDGRNAWITCVREK